VGGREIEGRQMERIFVSGRREEWQRKKVIRLTLAHRHPAQHADY